MSGSVVLETNLGIVKVELYWDHAPKVSSEGTCVPSAQLFMKVQ